MLSRRSFICASGVALGALGAAPRWLVRAAAQGVARRKILVVVFQRGAADGLNIVVPFSEPRYYDLRPTLAVPTPANGAAGAIDLDGRFGLHPSLQPLKEGWDQGQLAIVHAAGSPDPSRSHFDAQEFMECGTPGLKGEHGWLGRAVAAPARDISPLRAVAIRPTVPRTLEGAVGALAVDGLPRFEAPAPEAAAALERLYASSRDARLSTQGRITFDALRQIDAVRRQSYTPANGAQYVGAFGERMQQIARLIKADVGVEVAFADLDGWDHHVNEAPQLASLLREFGGSLAAFARDMGDRMSEIVLVTMSEFGRTAAQNGAGGTDHGHGGVMMLLGGGVRGGRVYGDWPGLEPEQLFERRDLAVTTDFRDVLGEVVQRHLGQRPDVAFPGHRFPPPLGLVRA